MHGIWYWAVFTTVPATSADPETGILPVHIVGKDLPELRPFDQASQRLDRAYAAGESCRGGAEGESASLALCYRNSRSIAAAQQLKTIAFPAVSCGLYCYPPALAAETALHEVKAFLTNNHRLEKVIFICLPRPVLDAYQAAYVVSAPLIHECVFAVLALESEPVDPRLCGDDDRETEEDRTPARQAGDVPIFIDFDRYLAMRY